MAGLVPSNPHPAREPTASARMLWPMLDYARHLGHDLDEVLSSAGITEAELREPDRRVPRRIGGATIRALYDRVGVPAFGLRAASFITPGTFDVLECACRASQTMGDAMRVVDRFARLVDDTIRCPLEVRGDLAFWHFDFDGSAEVRQILVEYLMAAVRTIGLRVGGALPVEEVWCRHPRPAYAEEYADVIGAPGRFGAPCDAIVYRREVLQLPIPSADPVLSGVLGRHVEDLLGRLPPRESFVGIVRDAVRREFQGGEPTMGRVARRLAITPSTLRRRLAEENLTFRGLREDLRFELSKIYLSDRSLSISEVAFLLSFRDVSAFYKAFRRTTKMTPAEYRERITMAATG